MRALHRVASLARNLFQRPRVERELDDELRTYVEQLTAEKRHAGMAEEEARRAARIEMGGLEQVKEEVRSLQAGRLLREFGRDLRYGARSLRKNPGFTAVAVLVLALGIGANTAMFSVAYGILLRPLPYGGAERVAAVYMRYVPRDFVFGTMCIRDFLVWKANSRAFEEISLFRGLRLDIGGGQGDPEQVQGAAVSAGFFPALRTPPLIGRTFGANEDRPGAPALAVLSESIWRRRFGGRPDVLGRTMLVNGAPVTIAGVMPSTFRMPRRETEVWTNLILNPPTRFGPWFYRGMARLKPGVTWEQANMEMRGVAQILMRENPYYKQLVFPVLGLRDAVLGTTLKPSLLVLAGAVGLVLLIAVVNVANLLLARATVRRREMALRLSLGAGRARLVRQLLAESVLLSVLGGVAGLVIAWAGVAWIRAANPGNLPLIEQVQLDAAALTFMAAVSMLAGVLFGLAPAMQSARTGLSATLQEGGRTGAPGRSATRARSALVVCEIALSLVLLVGAGLLLRSLFKLQSATGGFYAAPRSVLVMLLSPGNRKYAEPGPGLEFYDEVLRRARALPGVEAAAAGDSLPPDRQADADTFEIEGRPLPPGEIRPILSHLTVGPDYFRALGVPLLQGRDFGRQDTRDSRPAIIVSASFARRFFPNEQALGKRVGYGGVFREIVGIVDDVKYLGVTLDTAAAYYTPLSQEYGSRMFLVVRTAGDASGIAGELRREIQGVDPGVTLAQVETMEQALERSVARPRFDTTLLALFSGIALALAAAGVYGLIAYSVAQRTHEIGVRMALGAARADVVRMVVGQGARLAAIGVAIGLASSFALTRLLKKMMFGVEVTDGATFSVAGFTLLLAVLLAAAVPALRATRISPVAALRHE